MTKPFEIESLCDPHSDDGVVVRVTVGKVYVSVTRDEYGEVHVVAYDGETRGHVVLGEEGDWDDENTE